MTAIPSEAASKESRFFNRAVERSMRLWAGLILMVFVTSHLLNHAIGLFGVATMTEVQVWRLAVWHSLPGTVLLMGAVLLHIGLTLKRTLSRRTWRMPKMEALQLAFGIIIPFMLTQHIVGTRVLQLLSGTDDAYVNLLRYLWPDNALWQTVTLLVVWTHGVIGLYFAFHQRRWFKRMSLGLLMAAVLVPILSLAGFVASGREAQKFDAPLENWTAAQLAAYLNAMGWSRWVLAGFLAVIIIGVAVRFLQIKMGQNVTVRYTGHGEVHSPKGMTLLEMSRRSQVPHPSACGGRGRCASCRVLILTGAETLAPPSGLEQKMLARIRAPQRVRLACQIKPRSNMSVRILLPTDVGSLDASGSVSALEWGAREDLTILFADIRAFSALARHQLPSDLVVLLSRIIDELTQATLGHGGVVAQVQTDGIMAVFGLGKSAKTGAKAAVEAASDMLKTLALANQEFGLALPQPIRIGVGIHTGPVIVSRIGDTDRGYQMVVLGQTVDAASRLEEATKELVADCIISMDTLNAAGMSADAIEMRQLHYKNGETPISAAIFPEYDSLQIAMGVKPKAVTARTAV
jgi:adenylate cyclase